MPKTKSKPNKAKVGTIKITDIELGERFRKEYGNLDELALSIEQRGLILPIALKEQTETEYPYLLLDGGRRLAACMSLGFVEIPARLFTAELTEHEVRSIELEANIKRLDLSFIEECMLKKEIHDLQVEIHGEKISTAPNAPGWSQQDTANLLGAHFSTVSKDITLANAMKKMPDLPWENCATKTEAQKMVSKVEEAIIRDELSRRIASGADSKLQARTDTYIVGDFFEHVGKLPKNSFHLVELDPPYAIDLEDIKMDYGYKSYNEIPKDNYPAFMQRTLSECYKVMAENSWLICWFAPEPWFEEVYNWITEAGFKVHRMCGIWTKKIGQNMQPNYNLTNMYEMFFYAKKGSPTVVKQGRSNLFEFLPVASQEKTHPTERPIEMMKEIINTFAWERSRILVPFAGSGNTLIAGLELGMQPVGFDKSEPYKESYVIKVAQINGGEKEI